MKNDSIYDALIVGSGAAGYAAAVRSANRNKKVAIVTEGVNMGTSRNTGSDKQTYYKLSLGNESDSIRQMANDLFASGCVDGDTALAEAACSARCFLYLAELGVPFPHTAYGEYVGYKTDHDPCARASSAGPLTSKFMTEALEREADRRGVDILDGYYVTELLKDDSGVCGVAAVETATGRFTAFRGKNVILATGGPAGIYSRSVYPACHTGSASLALNAGVPFQNLTEWQYGLASLSPRWNVSGSYMQVLPRFISVDENGSEREFLQDYFETSEDALAMVFLKGYQWPFDSKKTEAGSSRIDLAVYHETVIRGRRVYLDFTRNPFGIRQFDQLPLSEEACSYLSGANASANTPIDRLLLMNEPAVALYASKGADLRTGWLEIALCAQHCNGGISVDADWQTSLPGLYAVGECAGTHGITRPGGAALNAGQTGALRVAEHICETGDRGFLPTVFENLAKEAENRHTALLSEILGTENNATAMLQNARARFDAVCGAVRDVSAFDASIQAISQTLNNLPKNGRIDSPAALADYYRLRDALTAQLAMLSACRHLYQTTNGARGGAVCKINGKPAPVLPDEKSFRNSIQQVKYMNGGFVFDFRPVRPIPEPAASFEVMWKQYRERNGQTKQRNT